MPTTLVGMFCCTAGGSQTSSDFSRVPKSRGLRQVSHIIELEHLEAFCVCSEAHLKARELFQWSECQLILKQYYCLLVLVYFAGADRKILVSSSHVFWLLKVTNTETTFTLNVAVSFPLGSLTGLGRFLVLF